MKSALKIWYYAKLNEKLETESSTDFDVCGPFDEVAMIDLIHAGTLSQETWIFREGTQNWVLLGETIFASYMPFSKTESQNDGTISGFRLHFKQWMTHPRSKRVAILLATFFGWIGAQSFYLGFWVRATIQFLLPFLSRYGVLISVIWGIFDASLLSKGRIAFAAKGVPIGIGSLKIENWLDNLTLRLWRIAFSVLVAGLLLLCVTLFAYHEKRVADESAADARFNQSLREIGARVARYNQAEEESRQQAAEWQQRMKLREDIRAATSGRPGSVDYYNRNYNGRPESLMHEDRTSGGSGANNR